MVVAPGGVEPARVVRLTGSRWPGAALTPETVRLALLGKVVTRGDAVSLLPAGRRARAGRGPDRRPARVSPGASAAPGPASCSRSPAVEPAGAVAVRPRTVVGLGRATAGAPAQRHAAPRPGADAASAVPAAGAAADGARAGGGHAAGAAVDSGAPSGTAAPPDAAQADAAAAVAIEDLVGNAAAAHRLVEWLELTFDRPELLERLGGSARLGVLIVGPEGVGKLTLARSAAAAAGAGCVELAAPGAAALEPGAASQRVHDAIMGARAQARAGARTLLVVTDVEALLPAASPPPLATLVLDALRDAVATPGLALVATTAAPESVDPRLRAPELVDRELRLALPDLRTRVELLRRLLTGVPLADDVDLRAVAERAPGFVAADLVAVRREAAVPPRCATDGRPRHVVAGHRLRRRADDASPSRTSSTPSASVRPISMSSSETLQTGGITLDQVGDMAEVKQALTEAVLWPLQYPDSFARLGVAAPRGVLVYGPPGCGKTFLLRALAGTGQLNVLAVKGAELLDKYVGESERAVRELFRRASDAAPALIFLDEIDALAPAARAVDATRAWPTGSSPPCSPSWTGRSRCAT